MSQPRHHQRVEILGDIIKVLRYPAGGVRAAIVQVILNERLEIAVLADCWPDGIREGARIFARGRLANESITGFKRATHFFVCPFIEVVPRRRHMPPVTQTDACCMSRQEGIRA